MAPVSRGAQRKSAPSRRPTTAPAQTRRTAAAAPPTRRKAAEDADETDFDAAQGASADDEEEDADDEELPEVIDLSDVAAATYEVIPKGLYPGYVDSIEYGLSQSSGLPMLTWILKLDYEEKERTLRFYTTLAGDGAGRSKATLARLDPDLDMSQLAPDEMDAHFGGAEVMIRVTIRPDREDRKVKRNNVADIFPIDEEE